MPSGTCGGLAVGLGPGSYTGCRIGVTTAKSLALARRIPVLGESSLAVWASGARRGLTGEDLAGCRLRVVLDARRGAVFSALFEASPGSSLTRLEDDRVLSLEDLVASLDLETERLVGRDRDLALVEAALADRGMTGRRSSGDVPEMPRALDLADRVRSRLARTSYDLEAVHALVSRVSSGFAARTHPGRGGASRAQGIRSLRLTAR